MTAPPPDKQPAAETLEEIAELIAKAHAPTFYQGALSRDILTALRSERERAVRIINEHQALDVCKDNCWTTIKAAIKEGK
jgi:hypothetical protein